ncbi:hypothetical protein Ciccas_012761, partial [Cichlidogyrus casuarinus]
MFLVTQNSSLLKEESKEPLRNQVNPAMLAELLLDEETKADIRKRLRREIVRQDRRKYLFYTGSLMSGVHRFSSMQVISPSGTNQQISEAKDVSGRSRRLSSIYAFPIVSRHHSLAGPSNFNPSSPPNLQPRAVEIVDPVNPEFTPIESPFNEMKLASDLIPDQPALEPSEQDMPDCELIELDAQAPNGDITSTSFNNNVILSAENNAAETQSRCCKFAGCISSVCAFLSELLNPTIFRSPTFVLLFLINFLIFF